MSLLLFLLGRGLEMVAELGQRYWGWSFWKVGSSDRLAVIMFTKRLARLLGEINI